MAWPREIKAEDVIGMKADELKAKLDGAASKDDLKALTDAQTANSGALADIQKTLKALTTPKPVETPNPDGGDDPQVRMLLDPEKFVNDATKDLRQGQAETSAKLNEIRAREKYGPIFAQYGEELMAAVSKLPVAMRANDNFWDFQIDNFIGKKVRTGEIKPGNYPSLLGSTAHGPRGAGDTSDPDLGFSPDMASWFRTRGLPLDKARKIYDLTVRDGEPLSIAKYTGKQAS